MSVEGGAAIMDDASCDASSMAFSPPASIAPTRTHFEALNRQVDFLYQDCSLVFDKHAVERLSPQGVA